MKNSIKAVSFVRVTNNTALRQPGCLFYQLDLIDEYAKANNIVIEQVFQNYSPEDLEWNLGEIVDYCEENEDVKYVIVSSYDRISSNAEEFADVEARLDEIGLQIVSATEQFPYAKMGEIAELIDVVFSQRDDNQHSKTVKVNMQRKAEAGYLMSAPPICYERTNIKGVCSPNKFGEALANVLPIVLEYMKPETLQRILLTVYEGEYMRVPTKTELRRWISNPYYAGNIKYDGKTYKGLHKPLFSVEVQNRLIKALS
jgi:site-specific DNA recombinase